ncbi:MAG: hypothetical protein WCK88_01710 [bacterium]
MLVTFCIVAAFFCGIYFEKSQTHSIIAKIPIPRVYLEQLKTKMNIRREGNVDIYLNSKKIQDDVVVDMRK